MFQGELAPRPPLSLHKQRRITELPAPGLSPWQIHKATVYSVAACDRYAKGLRKTA